MANHRATTTLAGPDCRSTPAIGGPPLAEGTAHDLSRVLKAVADPVRLQLIALIAAHEGSEACVCDLTGAFELSAPTISHHLKVLREAGLLTSERRGTWVRYRLQGEVLTRVADALAGLRSPRLPLLTSAADR